MPRARALRLEEVGVRLGERGLVIVNEKYQTSVPNIFAAGDVTDVFIEQVLIAIGEGAKAALSAYEYLLNWD